MHSPSDGVEAEPAVCSRALAQGASGGLAAEALLVGTHQGAVSLEHLDYYLDEFAFRFNRRRSRSRGKLFYRLFPQAGAGGTPPPQALVLAAPNRAVRDHKTYGVSTWNK